MEGREPKEENDGCSIEVYGMRTGNSDFVGRHVYSIQIGRLAGERSEGVDPGGSASCCHSVCSDY